MEYEIDDGVPFEPNLGGRPKRSAEVEAALTVAAKGELSANAAAKLLVPTFYGTSKATDEQQVERVKYIAKLIARRRSGFVHID